MQRIDCKASEVSPENPEARVTEPQYVMYWLPDGDAVVDVHFMVNRAFSVEDPHAVSVGPDISLRYVAHSASGAVTASVSLRRILFRFSGLTRRRYAFSLRELRSSQSFKRTPDGAA